MLQKQEQAPKCGSNEEEKKNGRAMSVSKIRKVTTINESSVNCNRMDSHGLSEFLLQYKTKRKPRHANIVLNKDVYEVEKGLSGRHRAIYML
jgi:hypothetical protein